MKELAELAKPQLSRFLECLASAQIWLRTYRWPPVHPNNTPHVGNREMKIHGGNRCFW